MRRRLFTGLIIAVIIILSGANVFVYINRDRAGPMISFAEKAIIYDQAKGTDVLLADVSAIDEVDGSVEVIIGDIFPYNTEDSARAKVYYIAIDSSGNVTKTSRDVEYIASDAVAASTAETNTGAVETDSGKNTNEPVNPEAPVITLTTSEVTIKVGDSFSYMNYISDIVDDKDTFATLSTRITLRDADFSRYTAGTYQIEYLVTDTDSNVSEPAVLTVKVQ